MKEHLFIFAPGVWEGKGMIRFSMADDELTFGMTWTVYPREDGRVLFSQIIEVNGLSDPMRNHFSLVALSKDSFSIELENHIVGRVKGTGFLTPTKIAWEFRNPDQSFEGYEVYELQPDGSYRMHAEFTAGEGLRTYVRGSIAPKPKVE